MSARTGNTLARRLARLIQFRSELAIVTVLVGAVGVGAVVRRVLPVAPTPSASFAAPADDAGDDAPPSAPADNVRPARVTGR